MVKRRESQRPPELAGQDVRKINHRQFYEVLNEVGFSYGPTFSGLKNLRARTHRPEMWAEMANFMERSKTSILSSTGRAEEMREEAWVIENGDAKEYCDEEATTPSTSMSSGTATPMTSTEQSILSRSRATSISSSSSEVRNKGVDVHAVPPQSQHALSEGLDISTQSVAIATSQLGKNASDHIDSRYAIHPVNLDLTLQLIYGTIHSGRISAITDIMVPVSIEEMYIAMPSPETKTFTMHATAGNMTDLVAYDVSGQEVIRVKNVEARELGLSGRGGQRDPNIMRLNWVVDYDAINQDNYRKALDTVHELRELPHPSKDTQDLNYMIKLMTAEMIDVTEGLTPAKPHFEKYRSWLLGHCRQHSYREPDVDASTLTRKIEIQHLMASSDVKGELLYTVYSNILPLFRGEIEDDELFQKHDLWARFNAAEGTMQCITSLSNLHSTQYCKASILEIGAGTGYGTQAILDGCTRNAGTPSMERRYQSYTFTDSDSELVTRGKDLFGIEYPEMDFCTLDIERDPELQGFERKYDIVYAVNVLHNTKNLRESARNIAKLLRLGGRVHITAFTSPNSGLVTDYVPFAFGISARWWCADEEHRSRTPLISIDDWVTALETAGFRIDFTVSDARLSTVYSCLVGTYIGERMAPTKPLLMTPQPSTVRPIILLYRHTWTPAIEQLREKLVSSVKGHEIIPMSFQSSTFELPDGASFVLSLLELDEPLLADITPSEFEKFKQLMGVSAPVLWVTSGVHLAPENPKGALINGFIRTLRNELATANFSLLDLSSKSPKEAAAQISSLVKLIMARPAVDSAEVTRKVIPDWEFCENQGLRYVPRVVPDNETSSKYTRQKDHETQIEPYRQGQKNLGLVCPQRGMLGSLIFEDQGWARSELPPDHIELCPDVFGPNPEDVATALDIVPLDTLGIACSGIIKRIGSAVEGLAIGDRIFTLSKNKFRNRFPIPAAACSKIPANIDPVGFTGSLIAYATVVRALLDIARIKKGEKILIHGATKGVGIAAIQLCKHIGAEIFATCASVGEHSFLTESHDIPPDHIFSSDDLSFREGVMAVTGGEGVDVVLNSLAGDILHESSKCLAPCGRFIDIGKRDMLLSGKLDMSGFLRNNIYAAVDLMGILTGGDKILRRLLKVVTQLYNAGAIKPIDPITRFPITKVQEAFSWMSTGTHIGSIALTVDPDPDVNQMVKVLQRPREVRFNPEATYLLIGGLGGIGCSLAVWMAEKGAKHLTFMTRSGARTEEARKALEDIESLGCGAHLLQCDVGDLGAVEAAMASMTRPLHGIIHAAMALKDGIFENMEHGDFVLSLQSKVKGLLNLEKILDQPQYPELDFFIVLSSISGVLGTPGQSNYAAASAFEDAFVRTRQRKGHTACSLDLGVISNIGYISQNPHLERKLVQQAGISSYNERQVQSLFQTALDTPLIDPVSITSQSGALAKAQVVTGVDIEHTDIRRVQVTYWFQDPKWRIIDSIASSRMNTSDSMGQSLFNDEKAVNIRLLGQLQDVGALQAEDVIRDIAQCIIWKAAVMTMVPAAEILPEHSLIRYGMDSLAAVEVRNWFLRVTEVEMKVEDVLAAVSIRSLAEKVYNGYKAKNEK